jgi:hypothetical protein
MKSRFGLLLAVPALIFFSTAAPQPLQAKSDAGTNLRLSRPAAREGGHYTRPLNDEVSKITRLIWSCSITVHLFTQQDIRALNAKYGDAIDDDVLLGNLKPATKFTISTRNAWTSAWPR